ncbi:MAG: preprotein translocase subunit SecY [Nanoarchaeota archaeon]|nr:preprotein translocase subunit SecY [Nanoarchaeota archaeon]
MSVFKNFLMSLPEVKGPSQKYLPFNTKLKWTAMILFAFFILGMIPLWGLAENALKHFDVLSILLGAKFGSITSLGIGPIVTASIVLQLLHGSGLIKLDTSTHDGRVFFQGLQKMLAIFFILFESIIYVFMGGLTPEIGISPWILVIQLCIGGFLILLMDDVINKWGFGSGISLFIAAGVSSSVFIRAFSPLTTTGILSFGSGQPAVGKVFVFISSFVGGRVTESILSLESIIATIFVFLLVVYAQGMKVEVPLSFGKVRGYGVRWPLKFFYTSNIPVILVAALMANLQLWARLMESWGRPILGTFTGQVPSSGLVYWLYAPDIVRNIITGAFSLSDISHAITYSLFMMIGATIFSIFWVQTSGMDAKSQAKQIMDSGLQVPGFRRDERVLETVLKRYITPLTIMGGLSIGLLAAIADLSGTLASGTGILLAVMIIYKMYEDIARQHAMDMYPALKKVMAK